MTLRRGKVRGTTGMIAESTCKSHGIARSLPVTLPCIEDQPKEACVEPIRSGDPRWSLLNHPLSPWALRQYIRPVHQAGHCSPQGPHPVRDRRAQPPTKWRCAMEMSPLFDFTCMNFVFHVGQYEIDKRIPGQSAASWTTMANPTESKDLLLVKECLAGSEQAWTEFYRRYVGLVRNTVKRQLGRGAWDHIDDVTQSVFAALIPALKNYDSA